MDTDPSFYSSKRNSYPLTPLSHVHICEAIERSTDNGATLTFSKMNLSDVGAQAVEELATIERGTPEDENTIKRYAIFSAISMIAHLWRILDTCDCQLGLR